MTEPPRVYFDSNVFIAAMENPGAHSDHAWWLILAIDEGRIAGVTSELTLAEVLVKPIELADETLVAAYERMISPAPQFEVLPVGRDVLRSAAHLRARRNSVRLPDAIHLATALAASCDFLVSDDRRLHATDGIKAFGVTPFTLDDILAETQ